MIDPTRLEPIESQIFVEERPDSKPSFVMPSGAASCLDGLLKILGLAKDQGRVPIKKGHGLQPSPFS
jgi:hypothetical protein